MSKFEQDYFNLLINNYGFYVEDLKGEQDKELWIALKTVKDDGKYAVIISKSYEEEENLKIAEDYLKSLGKSYSLHNIILYKSYDRDEKKDEDFSIDENCHRVIVDVQKREVLKSDRSSEPLAKILEFLLKKKEEPKVPWYKRLRCGKVTGILIGLNILAFLVCLIVATALGAGFFRNIVEMNPQILYWMGAKHNNAIIFHGEYYRLVTSMFLHGGIVHLLFNMYAIYILGDFIERIYGAKKYLAIYFVSGIVASIFSLYFSPVMGVGASGAIFGLLGAALVFAYNEKDRIGKALVTNIIVIILLNVFIGLSMSNIDISARFGGFIAGAILGLFFHNYKIIRK
ncbi:TPA: rhomboid family intramembrane serine protease [Clostridium perfringens]|uniref:rhomboid family intramembrane serine protease n=1 Tax=Clostridium perfringens TaxID=1502 RepID=UPI001A2DAC4B|nr:rhomboid family intramembrane serine protease [Clostridium perfringens]HAT4210912.1 rhomboid family intramembrane serine protease [Clostridium perfringens]